MRSEYGRYSFYQPRISWLKNTISNRQMDPDPFYDYGLENNRLEKNS